MLPCWSNLTLKLREKGMTLMQTNGHIMEIAQDWRGETEDYFLLVSADGCMEAVCEDVSVWITWLQGSVSPIQHIISGRLQVVSSLWIKWHPGLWCKKNRKRENRCKFVEAVAPLKCFKDEATNEPVHAGGVQESAAVAVLEKWSVAVSDRLYVRTRKRRAMLKTWMSDAAQGERTVQAGVRDEGTQSGSWGVEVTGQCTSHLPSITQSLCGSIKLEMPWLSLTAGAQVNA